MKILALSILTLLFSLSLTAADTNSQYAAVKSLGELNGIALQCKYFDQVKRMKAAVVQTAPKERSFGLAFDEATNDAFLAFIQASLPCPGAAGFEIQVGEKIAAMREAFKQI